MADELVARSLIPATARVDALQWVALATDRKLTLRHVPPEAGPPTWLEQVFSAAGNPGGLELLGERGTSAPAEN